MSSITGGIFSRPKGQTGGLVFGQARSRKGKVVTIREKVIPANPRTPLQVTVRNKFKSVLTTVRTLGASIYQVAWNRAVGQLAGFQSLMSVLLQQISDSLDFTFSLPINLGILHFPTTLSFASTFASSVDVTFSSETGSNGTPTDTVVILFIAKTASDRALSNGIIVAPLIRRLDGLANLSGFISGATYEIYTYLLGDATAAGLKSIAAPHSVTVL